MSNGAMVGGVAAGASAAAAVHAIKASGVIVQVTPEEFQLILRRAQAALVVHAPGGFLAKRHQYLLSYKGLAFFTKTNDEIALPSSVEMVEAGKIWVPS